MSSGLRDNILLLMIAHACFFSEPAIVHAQNANYNPQNFTQPLNVARGAIIPSDGDSFYLTDVETCDLVVAEFGWDRKGCASIDALVFALTPSIDNVMFKQPVSDGYVKLDDWNSTDLSEEIRGIEEDYIESVKNQSRRLGQTITFDGWLLYPTVDASRNALYYATILNWSGNRTINVRVSLFDRHGYVPFDIVPSDPFLAAKDVKTLVLETINSYKPLAGTSYAEFVSGDKVAGYGALGVLATMLGVKYGKGVFAGVAAIALLILKKAWFVIFLPFVWIASLFRRKK